ncbi:polyprenyl synthetase family protein [Brochothrix campestris]|uniref:Heptaprenyl diphosphate synthase component II n=1 Tax=Brochothrix campestris FSL F6-1037 TaxID=1265861 RepID=W7CPN4_9LIST|nr:polyprenyl synthetase family protein [Brochothrix campestris]EUJ41609.1 heptaprenyl diphosphate synthase component II [Brochothrix campestris FSL F6-1037]
MAKKMLDLMSLYASLKKDLKTIDKALLNLVESEESPIIEQAANQLLAAGGKRIRPIFVLLCARLGKINQAAAMKLAVAIELIHSASILHDDVVDDSDMRRGKISVKAKWDNHIAMYAGDYLFAKSLESVAQMGNPQIHQILSQTTYELSLGEIEQIRYQYDATQNIRVYLRRIKRKTAVLIAASCQLGAIAGGLEQHAKKLYLFGYYVGMSFQIRDDILDYTMTAAAIGKPVGEDLRQGNITLPALLAMKNPLIQAQIASVNETTSPAELQAVLTAIRSSGAIEQAQLVSEQYLRKAVAILDSFQNPTATKPLRQITNYLLDRDD